MTRFKLFLLALLSITTITWSAQADTPNLSPKEHAHAQATLTALDKKQAGVAAIHAAHINHPLLRKIILWRSYQLDSDEGDFVTLRRFVEDNPTWPSQTRLWRRAEAIMPDTMESQELVGWFQDHAPVTGNGALRYALALRDLGSSDQLASLAPNLWLTHDFKVDDEAQFHQTFGRLIGKPVEVARLERLLREGKSTAARRQAKRLGQDYVLLADARIRLAARRSGVDAAIRRVPANLQNDPGLLYERTRWRLRKKLYSGVVELLVPARADLPDPALWWPLRHQAARWALDRGDHEAAYLIAEGHGASQGIVFADGEWLAGWIALRFLNDPALARPHFETLYEGVGSPISRARGAFWAGRAADAADDKAESQRWYGLATQHPETYYGQLAAEEIGQALTIDLPRHGQPSIEARAAFRAQELAQAATLLGELEAWDLQQLFIDRLRGNAVTADQHRLVAEFARSLDRADLAVRTAKQARRDSIILSDQLYPLRPIVTHPDLEETLVLALVRQESSFYPRARSRSDALGLMQLLPGTARDVALKENVPYSRARLTDDPAYNLRLGQSYLAALIDRFQGSIPLALAGYNAGPNRVATWIERYGDPRTSQVDLVDWIERIPFSETRNYVQRITETMPVYEARLVRPDPFIASPAILEQPDLQQ